MGTVMLHQPVLVLPLFWVCLAELVPQIFQNLPVLMLVNHLVWKNKLMRNNAFSHNDH